MDPYTYGLEEGIKVWWNYLDKLPKDERKAAAGEFMEGLQESLDQHLEEDK